MPYDSTRDTLNHIRLVAFYLNAFASQINARGIFHDASKLESPEKELFDEFRPKLDTFTYGSDEYKTAVAQMGEGIRHHYAVNSHHPEHYEDGIEGMDLLDLVEMFCDWKAASERNGKVSLMDSIPMSAERFKMAEQLTEIFKNTARRYPWK